jgi:hypothetical protein
VSEQEKWRLDADNLNRLKLKIRDKNNYVCIWFTDPNFKKKITDAVYN